MNSSIKAALFGVTLGAAFLLGAYITSNAYEEKISEYKLEAEKQYSELLKQKLESDKRNSARVVQAELAGLKELEELKETYEKTIADLRADFKPSGVSKCPKPDSSVSRTDSDSTELICYSRDELQSKVERSMALAREADELAVKYNMLLKIYGDSKK